MSDVYCCRQLFAAGCKPSLGAKSRKCLTLHYWNAFCFTLCYSFDAYWNDTRVALRTVNLNKNKEVQKTLQIKSQTDCSQLASKQLGTLQLALPQKYRT